MPIFGQTVFGLKPHLARIFVLSVLLKCVCVVCVVCVVLGALKCAPALQTPPKFHEKTPQRRKNEISGGREKKKREILAPFGPPTLRPPNPSRPHLFWVRAPTLPGPHPFRPPTPSGPPPSCPHHFGPPPPTPPKGKNWPRERERERETRP